MRNRISARRQDSLLAFLPFFLPKRQFFRVRDCQIAQGIRPDQSGCLLHCVADRDEMVFGINVGPVITGMQKGRRGDPDMNLGSPGLAHETNEGGQRRPAHNGIIHQDHAPARQDMPYRIQLQPDHPLPLCL